MKVLCSAVLGVEAVVVFLATSLAASDGSVANPAAAWIAGGALVVLLLLAIGTLRRRWGLIVGWILQILVLATSLVVGWSMLVVGAIFVALWFLAIRNGRRVDIMRAHAADDPPGAE